MLQSFNIPKLLSARNWAGNLGIEDSMSGAVFPGFDQNRNNKDIDEQGLHSKFSVPTFSWRPLALIYFAGLKSLAIPEKQFSVR